MQYEREPPVIYRLSWITFDSAGSMLFLKDQKRDVLFDPGGRRQAGLPDEEALARKILRDIGVTLYRPQFLASFRAPAHKKKEGTMVEQRLFMAEGFHGPLRPREGLTAVWVSRTHPGPFSYGSKGVIAWAIDQGLM
jgi:hypothetical protein